MSQEIPNIDHIEAFPPEKPEVHPERIELALQEVLQRVRNVTKTKMSEPDLHELLLSEGRSHLEELSKDRSNVDLQKKCVHALTEIVEKNQASFQ